MEGEIGWDVREGDVMENGGTRKERTSAIENKMCLWEVRLNGKKINKDCGKSSIKLKTKERKSSSLGQCE